MEMGLVRRETPFGSDPRSGKRSLYRIDDPFLRLWFRVVAPHRAAFAAAPRETRLRYWRRHRSSLESLAWEEQCRMAVPLLHRSDTTLAGLGPWEPAQRYWRGNAPEPDVVARSVDGRRARVASSALKFRDSKYLESGDGFPLPAFVGTSFAGMTSFQRDTLPLRWPSFPRKRESISVRESRNLGSTSAPRTGESCYSRTASPR